MAIEKLATLGLVIDSHTVGENDALLRVYTRDFGLIFAKSASLKKSKKLMGHILAGRLTNLTLVKGKDVYRVAGSSESSIKSELLFIVAECVKRFFHGEEKSAQLFDRLISYADLKDVNLAHAKNCVYLDTLINLGYLDVNKIGLSKEEYLKTDANSFYIFTFLRKDECVRSLREAIESSML